jgi:hypothetical protein
MRADAPLALHLRSLEELLLQSDVRKSERVSRLLADGFIEFGSSGRVFTKAQIVSALGSEHPTTITAHDFSVSLLAPHVALVTYRAHLHTEPPVYTLRSSIWQQRGGQWQMAFHQGTVASSTP